MSYHCWCKSFNDLREILHHFVLYCYTTKSYECKDTLVPLQVLNVKSKELEGTHQKTT